MYGERVQDILETTEILRRKGLYKGSVGMAYLPILGTRNDGRDLYGME